MKVLHLEEGIDLSYLYMVKKPTSTAKQMF